MNPCAETMSLKRIDNINLKELWTGGRSAMWRTKSEYSPALFMTP